MAAIVGSSAALFDRLHPARLCRRRPGDNEGQSPRRLRSGAKLHRRHHALRRRSFLGHLHIGRELFSDMVALPLHGDDDFLGLVSVYAINVVLIELRYIPVPSSGQAWTILPQFLYVSLVAGAIGVLSWNMGNKIITPVNGVLFMNGRRLRRVRAFRNRPHAGAAGRRGDHSRGARHEQPLSAAEGSKGKCQSIRPYGSGKLPSTQAKLK